MIDILDLKYVVISLIGSHAGEEENKIIEKKMEDIQSVGYTLWLVRSNRIKPEMVQDLCSKAEAEKTDCYCLFIKGDAKPTISKTYATHYSKDRKAWELMGKDLSPVSGKIDGGAYGLVFNKLELVDDAIDWRNYNEFVDKNEPLRRNMPGASTHCAIRKDIITLTDINERYRRKVVAIGKLCKPFCVYLR
jgi:hypothetical protein